MRQESWRDLAWSGVRLLLVCGTVSYLIVERRQPSGDPSELAPAPQPAPPAAPAVGAVEPEAPQPPSPPPPAPVPQPTRARPPLLQLPRAGAIRFTNHEPQNDTPASYAAAVVLEDGRFGVVVPSTWRAPTLGEYGLQPQATALALAERTSTGWRIAREGMTASHDPLTRRARSRDPERDGLWIDGITADDLVGMWPVVVHTFQMADPGTGRLEPRRTYAFGDRPALDALVAEKPWGRDRLARPVDTPTLPDADESDPSGVYYEPLAAYLRDLAALQASYAAELGSYAFVPSVLELPGSAEIDLVLSGGASWAAMARWTGHASNHGCSIFGGRLEGWRRLLGRPESPGEVRCTPHERAGLPPLTPLERAERYHQLRARLRTLAAAQDAHYARHFAYSIRGELLGPDLTEGVVVNIAAGTTTWVASATHVGLGTHEGCSILYDATGELAAPTWPMVGDPRVPGEVSCTEGP